MSTRFVLTAAAGFAACVAVIPLLREPVRAASSVFADHHTERPGVRHRITPADLPQPYATESVDNGPHLVERPAKAWPQAPAGFQVTEYARGLDKPRLLRKAPNGDLLVVESDAGRVKVLRGLTADGKVQQVEVFATGLHKPFGVNFYPPGPNPRYVYVANTDSVVRFPYQNGDVKARGAAETVVPDLPAGGQLRGGGHWTRDIVFSKDGQQMFVSVGSLTNIDDPDTSPDERERADILVFTPEGKGRRIFAAGIRNPVGLAVDPQTGQLWTSVNERDELGDNLVPDYITHVQEGGFYGWPWYYLGGHQDPRHQGKHPELKSKVIVPDVLLQPHHASLQLTFYDAAQFPAEYRGHLFAAQHGSWNRAVRTGYEVIRVPVVNGKATGEYEDFLTGFVTPDGDVWGRPVGVAVAQDGALIVTDDESNTVWRVGSDRNRQRTAQR